MIVDLASTNGCSVDGERVSGSRPLRAGALVSAGTTTLAVERTLDDSEDVPEAQAPVPQMIPATPAGGSPAPWPQQGEAEPPRASDRLAAAVSRSADQRNDLEPQSSRKEVSDPLIPAPPRKPIVTAAPSVDQDVLATLAPARPAGPTAEAGESGSRTFYINVLGRRVGPLSRAQARELKTRELKGTLTPSDLAEVEADSGAQPPADIPSSDEPAAAGDDQRTYYITVLGKRVGPLTRQQARDLKARELRGGLSADEVERFVVR